MCLTHLPGMPNVRMLAIGHLGGSSRAWNDRMQVTEESCVLSIKHISFKFECSGLCARKITKADAEEIALLSAVCLALTKEVQAMVPVSDDVMQDLM